jgi:thioredoxin-related protein
MKKLMVCLIACWTVWQVCAGEADWLTGLSKAQVKAKEDKKMVLMDFNGSNWCPPCKALRKTVLDSQAFINYAKTNLVLVDVDFPQPSHQTEELKKANEALSRKYSVDALPTVIVLSSEGKELKRLEGYDGASPADFIAQLEKLKHQS